MYDRSCSFYRWENQQVPYNSDSLTNFVSLFYGTICLALGEAAMLMFKLKECGHIGSVSHGACASLRTSAPSLELTPLLASGFHTCVVVYTEL